jgi:hypothetical protein
VKKIEAPSYGSSLRGIIEGRIDCATCQATSGITYEVASGPRGYFWPEYPPEEKEAWQRARKIAPYTFPNVGTFGAGVSETTPRKFIAIHAPWIIGYPEHVSDELAYWMAKSIHESYDSYKGIHKDMELYKLEKCITPQSASYVPYHRGAIKYFKEIDWWTDGHQRAQDELMGMLKKLREKWEEAQIEAVEKKIPGREFPQFWTRKYEEATGEELPEIWWQFTKKVK